MIEITSSCEVCYQQIPSSDSNSFTICKACMKYHHIKCCDCKSIECNDGKFTDLERSAYRCSSCEKKLYDQNKLHSEKKGYYACDCNTYSYDQLHELTMVKRIITTIVNDPWKCPECNQTPIFCRSEEDQTRAALKVDHDKIKDVEICDVCGKVCSTMTIGKTLHYLCDHCQKLCNGKPSAGDAPHDIVNNPSHYQGKEMDVIQVIESFELNFNLGNAIKYILRANKKSEYRTDLLKAVWYLHREVGKKDD